MLIAEALQKQPRRKVAGAALLTGTIALASGLATCEGWSYAIFAPTTNYDVGLKTTPACANFVSEQSGSYVGFRARTLGMMDFGKHLDEPGDPIAKIMAEAGRQGFRDRIACYRGLQEARASTLGDSESFGNIGLKLTATAITSLAFLTSAAYTWVLAQAAWRRRRSSTA